MTSVTDRNSYKVMSKRGSLMASRINTDGENGADQMEQIFDVSEENHELRLELHEIQEQDAETR